MEYEYKGTERTVKVIHSENGELLSFNDETKANWNQRKYRIIEKAGRFYIQALYQKRKWIFSKKIVDEWRLADTEGIPLIDWIHQVRCQSFPTLEDAKTMINNFKKGTIIHDC